MKAFGTIILFIVNLTFSSCFNSRKINEFCLKEIIVVKLSHSMQTTSAIADEETFDLHARQYRDMQLYKEDRKASDTIRLSRENFKLDLGERLYNYSNIDARTKVIFVYPHGRKKTILLDKFGVILYNDQFYRGSIEYLQYLRGNDIE